MLPPVPPLPAEDLGKLFIRTGDLHNPPSLFVLGDSHALFFAGMERMEPTHSIVPHAHAGVRVYYLGPGLAGSLIKPHSRNRTAEKITMALEEPRRLGSKTLLLVFGEIDCRYHIRYIAEKMFGVEPHHWLEAARLTVKRYVAFLLSLKLQGFNPVVWAPIASTPRCAEANPWITLGTTQERNWLTRHVIALLQAECQHYQIPLLSVFEFLVDSALNTKPEFSSDGTHLSQRYWGLWLEQARQCGLFAGGTG